MHASITILRPFFPGLSGSAGARRKSSSGHYGTREESRGRHTHNLVGRHSIRTNQRPTSLIPHFYAGCPSCRNPPTLSWLGTGTKYAGLHTQWLRTRKWPLKHRWWIRDVFHACTTSVTNKDLHRWRVSGDAMMNMRLDGRHERSWQTYWLAMKIQRCRIMFQCSRTRCTVWLQLDIHSINLAVALHHPYGLFANMQRRISTHKLTTCQFTDI